MGIKLFFKLLTITSAGAAPFLSGLLMSRAGIPGLPGMSATSGVPGMPNISGPLNFAGSTPTIKETSASMITNGTCPPVHMIVARASTELPGTGVIGSLALLVMAKQQGSTLETIQYPALLAPYAPSSGAGTQATIKAINAMAEKCPDTKMVLMGYSQGAHIILDAMCGGGATSQANALSKLELAKANPAVSPAVQSQVVAMVQMGDPRKINGVSYNLGTSKAQGLFPRTKDQMCSAATSSKIASYCDAGDSFCDSGVDLAAHLIYTEKYNIPAAKFITDKISGAGAAATA